MHEKLKTMMASKYYNFLKQVRGLENYDNDELHKLFDDNEKLLGSKRNFFKAVDIFVLAIECYKLNEDSNNYYNKLCDEKEKAYKKEIRLCKLISEERVAKAASQKLVKLLCVGLFVAIMTITYLLITGVGSCVK